MSVSGALPVVFFLDDGELDALRTLDPGRGWRELQRGERAWVLQTYLHLAGAGYPAQLASQLPVGDALVVFHAKQRRALPRWGRGRRGKVLVAARGDLKATGFANFEVVQNRHSADGRRQLYVPHWPQPGLLPREAARGTTLARAAYKGFDRNLHPYFRGAEWRAFLAARGIEWIADSVPFAERATDSQALEWPDFRHVDLVVAVRPPDLPRRDSKPATKLCNAWLAGVPALLSPDVAFRELRRSPLDYLEVENPEQAQAGVERLLAEPDLYARMVENGRRRAAECTVEAVAAHWVDLLDRVIPKLLAERRR
jgi:hypothetical protein